MKVVRNCNKPTTLDKLKFGDLFEIQKDMCVYILTNQKNDNNCFLVVDLEIGYACYLAPDMKVTKIEGTLYVGETKDE